jgi:hypothetical protein
MGHRARGTTAAVAGRGWRVWGPHRSGLRQRSFSAEVLQLFGGRTWSLCLVRHISAPAQAPAPSQPERDRQ